MSKTATMELDAFLKETDKQKAQAGGKKAAPKKAPKAQKKAAPGRASKAAPESRAPFSVHAMGVKNDRYTKVLDKTPCESLAEAMELVEKWADKEDVHEVSIHIR